jgi:hypothetical protein
MSGHRRELNVTPAARESAHRKITLTLGVSGAGDEQVNVLLTALAHVAMRENLEMASVICALTSIYLEFEDMYCDEDDDDD